MQGQSWSTLLKYRLPCFCLKYLVMGVWSKCSGCLWKSVPLTVLIMHKAHQSLVFYNKLSWPAVVDCVWTTRKRYRNSESVLQLVAFHCLSSWQRSVAIQEVDENENIPAHRLTQVQDWLSLSSDTNHGSLLNIVEYYLHWTQRLRYDFH